MQVGAERSNQNWHRCAASVGRTISLRVMLPVWSLTHNGILLPASCRVAGQEQSYHCGRLLPASCRVADGRCCHSGLYPLQETASCFVLRGQARAEDFRASSVSMRSLRVCELQARHYCLPVLPDLQCCCCEVVLIAVDCVLLSCLLAAWPGKSRRGRALSVPMCSLRSGE